MTLPLSNTTVAFRQSGTEDLLSNVPVVLTPLGEDQRIMGNLMAFTHKITWDDTLRFTNGDPVSQGDEVLWQDYEGGPTLTQSLHKPARHRFPFVAATALIEATE